MLAGHEAWVATAPSCEPIGYAVAGAIGPFLHLRELSVDPAHGRRGIGTALVEHVVAAARQGRFRGVTLTTFRDVPFNAPFYARLGFSEMPPDRASEALRAAFLREVPAGIDPSSRVLMARMIPDGGARAGDSLL
jgi:GNAT superfamily N-acetyltransferase